MVANNTYKKKRANCYKVINRKKGWQQLYLLMNRKNIVNKINNDVWSELSLEQKKNFLRNIRDEYMSSLQSIGMSKTDIIRTKSYLLLNVICNFKTKTLNNHLSIKNSWYNLKMCALKHK